MSNNFVYIENQNEYDLYYDFKEETFYSTIKKIEQNYKTPSLWYFIALVFALQIDNFLSIERDLQNNIIMALIGIIIATVFAYIIYQRKITALMNNNTVKAHISLAELKELVIKSQKKAPLKVFILLCFMVAFIVLFYLFINYVQISFMILSSLSWFCFILVFVSINFFKKRVFFSKYKRGEISL